MKGKNKQQGFTIIELVVVILLLGILTATALPRFMNVSDQAHGAVVNGVASGLRTGVALARASWMAKGQPATLADFNNLAVNSLGYVVGQAVGQAPADSEACKEIFDGLLQSGRPYVQAASGTGAFAAGDISGADASAQFVAKLVSSNCNYAYVGQFRNISAGDLPVLVYDPAEGTVEPGTAL